MIQLELEREIGRPIEEVFARLADIDRYREWLPKSLIFKGGGLVAPDEAVARGTEFVDVTPLGKLRGEVTSFEPPTGIGFEQTLRRWGKPVLISHPSYQLSATDRGTHVSHQGEAELFGALTFTEPLVRVLAIRERTRIVDELKRSLEST
jgi:uncharacterized protein YndB with AHSA1/START domain